MTYEAWRISYQSSEQAARAAFAECAKQQKEIAQRDAEIARLTAERDAAFAMSRCECGADEACANLATMYAEVARLRAECDSKQARIDAAYAPRYDEAAMDAFVAEGTRAWADEP